MVKLTDLETCDMSEAETPKEAAKMLYEYLTETLAVNENEVILDSPDEAAAKRQGSGAWTVTWEGGPHKWGVNATMGGGVYGTENPSLKNMMDMDGILAEPYYSFDVQFHDR